MLEINWDSVNEWNNPKIVPYGTFLISPQVTGLSYGLNALEGMKAYFTPEGNL
jgi:branched-chain amino acid aminotransferase